MGGGVVPYPGSERLVMLPGCGWGGAGAGRQVRGEGVRPRRGPCQKTLLSSEAPGRLDLGRRSCLLLAHRHRHTRIRRRSCPLPTPTPAKAAGTKGGSCRRLLPPCASVSLRTLHGEEVSVCSSATAGGMRGGAGTTTPMIPCAATASKMASDGGPAAGGPPAPRPVSFGFTRTTARRRLVGEGGAGAAAEPDFISAVEGSELRSLRPAPTPKALVIPLIQRNQWKKPATPPVGAPDQQRDDGVESQAVREIIEECRQSQERWESGTKGDPNLAIPLLLQNRVPDGYEDSDRVDVSLRPESSTEADYEVVPVEAYGVAMLRGMGWKAGEGIGRTFKQDVKPLEHQLRPRGLGLGADRSAIQDLQPARPPRPPKPGEERRGGEEEPLGLVAGGAVLIVAGPHKDLYGKIEGVDPDNARVMVKLAIGDKIVTISQHSLRPVTRKEYEKLAKDLSRLSKAHKEEEEKQRNGPTDAPDARVPREKGEEKDRKRKQPADSESDAHAGKQSKGSSSSSSSSRSPHWLRRDLRVRFVDKLYKGGKYYNTKMLIEDVLSPDTCVCRTEEGQVLDGIREAMLETVIPRGAADWVLVVLGEHAGRVGRILQRDQQRSRALVQLQRDEDGDVLALDYDAVCHYVGGTEDD